MSNFSFKGATLYGCIPSGGYTYSFPRSAVGHLPGGPQG